jgi:O-antigen/teichoic acid export membrane protein
MRLNQTIKKIPSHWLALADQVLVSGSNFAVGIILARAFGVQTFGLYVIATTYLMYANTFQSSLVVSPMMTAIPHELDETKRQNLVSGFLCYALMLSFLSVIGIALVAYILGAVVPTLHLGANTVPLMLAIIGFQLQDWLRRALYALQKTERVVLLDIMAYGGQILSLAVLYYEKLLTPVTALLSMAGIFFFAAIIILMAQNIMPNYKQATQVAKTYWRGSRDFFIAWQLQWAGSQGLMLVGGGFLGKEVVGAIRATQNLAAPLNVIFQWMENVIPVRAVAHLKRSGLPAMHQFLGRIGKIGGVVFGIAVIGLYFVSEPLIVFLYGETYRPYAFFVVLQGIYLWQGHFYRLELFACRATDNTAEVARASLIVAIVSIGVALISIHLLGGSGIMLALILGQTASYLYLLYRRKFTKQDNAT